MAMKKMPYNPPAMENRMEQHLPQVVDIAAAAGREIMEVYAGEGEFRVESKSDGSPLTEADRRAHNLIAERLAQLAPDIPLLSEESEARAFAERRAWRRYWLVDPLDGTKGFIRRNDQFSVNIALIENSRAVLGAVHAPTSGASYFAARGGGAFKTDGGAARPIRARKFDGARAVMVTSRSHAKGAVEEYRARLAAEGIEVEVSGAGSSLENLRGRRGRGRHLPALRADFRMGHRGRALRAGGGRRRPHRRGRRNAALQQGKYPQSVVSRRRGRRI